MRNIPQVSLLLYLGSVAFAFAAVPSFIFDLKTKTTAPDVLTRVYGRGLDDDGAKGVPIAGGYDCNGDGHLDYAFAQIQGDPLGRIGVGEVTLVFGDGTIGGSIDSDVSIKYLFQKSDDLTDWSTQNLRIGTGSNMNIYEPKILCTKGELLRPRSANLATWFRRINRSYFISRIRISLN